MLRYRKPNLIQSSDIGSWIATQKLCFASDTRNGKALKLDSYLNGSLVVTFGDDEIYRGSDIDAAAAAFNDAF